MNLASVIMFKGGGPKHLTSKSQQKVDKIQDVNS